MFKTISLWWVKYIFPYIPLHWSHWASICRWFVDGDINYENNYLFFSDHEAYIIFLVTEVLFWIAQSEAQIFISKQLLELHSESWFSQNLVNCWLHVLRRILIVFTQNKVYFCNIFCDILVYTFFLISRLNLKYIFQQRYPQSILSSEF